MKLTFTLFSTLIALTLSAQLPVSIYQAPSSGNTLNRFEHDDNYLYAVKDSSVDQIDATTNAVVKLFSKPWGASVNANGKAIFSNGKSIIGQYIPGSPYKYKYWVYNGTTFDTLFTLINTQIDNWVTDGNVCYFYVGANKTLFKSDFTKAGTLAIAGFSSNTLLVTMQLFNHDLYFFNTTSSTNNNALKKYSMNALSTIDSSYNYALGDFKMQVYNNNFYFAHYQFMTVPNARYTTKIVKIDAVGSSQNLYSDTTSVGIYVKGFMGGLGNTILMDASIGASTNEYVYSANTLLASTPTLLQNGSGSSLKPQSAPLYKQASGIVYLDVYDPANSSSGNRDLWQTDGTVVGTRMVTAPTATNIIHGSGFSLGNVDQWCLQGVTCGNTLYSTLNYTELWMEDGLNAPTKITVPNYGTFGSLAVCAGNIFMTAQNTTTYKMQIMKVSCATSAGINELGSIKNKLKIYPNPSTAIINIDHAGLLQENTQVYIHTILGEEMYKTGIDKSQKVTRIDISFLSPGAYMISTNGGYNQLIIKE